MQLQIENYYRALENFASRRIQARAAQLAPAPKLIPAAAGLTPDAVVAQRLTARNAAAKLARATFPNDFGNYTGKRKPAEPARPVTPRHRFAWLQSLYLLRRRSYQVQKPAKPRANQTFFALDNGIGLKISAATRSHARAAIKRLLKRDTTRGFSLYRLAH